MEPKKMEPKPPEQPSRPQLPAALAMPELPGINLEHDTASQLASATTRQKIIDWIVAMMPWPFLPENLLRLVVGTAYDLIVTVLLNAAGKLK